MSAENKGGWQPGQSGNPKGRPKKGQALTEILRRAGSKTFEGPDGRRVASKRWMAQVVWRLVTHGEVTLLDGKKLEVENLKEWKELVEWLLTRVDGPPIERKEIATEDQREIRVRFIPPGAEE